MMPSPPATAQATVSVVVRVYNERASIEQVLAQTLAVQIPDGTVRLVVVDDGSTDGTRQWLDDRLNESDLSARLCVVGQLRNGGKGAAIRAALPHADGDVIVFMDADLELTPADIPRLVGPILEGRADAAFGNRFPDGMRNGRNVVHYLANWSLTRLARLITRLPLHDVEVGLKAFRTDALRAMALSSQGFEIEMELIVKTAALGCRLAEVPVQYTARGVLHGKKFGWWDGVLAVFWLLYYRSLDHSFRLPLRGV